MRTWEYKEIVQHPIYEGYLEKVFKRLEPPINYEQLGEKGWELVTVTPISAYSGITIAVHSIFKRPTN